MTQPARIAVLIPCLNEEAAVANVIRDFRAALPVATVYVYDNGSSDRTAEVAMHEAAVVRTEPLRGKGNVMRRMFADVEADIYVLVDGDDTYDAASAPALVRQLCDEGLDMINGARREQSDHAYRPGHRFGNRLLTGLVAWFFGKRINDMLSGYRVMSRRFVKSFPALAGGFEIETELTVHALQLNLPIAEVMTPYRERPAKSSSKLRTIPDGAARTTGGPSRVRIPADENLSLIAAVRMDRVLLPANPPRRSDRRWTTRIPDRLS